jgi:hypothetical protein
MLLPQIATKSVPNLEAIEKGVIIATQEELPYMITSGDRNCLFHYVSYNDLHGIIVSPIQRPANEVKSIHEAFFKTIIQIRNVLLLKKKQASTEVRYNIQIH